MCFAFVVGLIVFLTCAVYAFTSWKIIGNCRSGTEKKVSRAQYKSLIWVFLVAALSFAVFALTLIVADSKVGEPLAWVPVIAPVAIIFHCLLRWRVSIPVSTLQSVRATFLPERTFMFGVVIAVAVAGATSGDLNTSNDLMSWFVSLIFYLPIQQIVVDARGAKPLPPIGN